MAKSYTAAYQLLCIAGNNCYINEWLHKFTKPIMYSWNTVFNTLKLYHVGSGVPLNKTGFMRWNPGHPNKPSNGDYLLMSRIDGGLADIPSTAGWKVPFICEQELW